MLLLIAMHAWLASSVPLRFNAAALQDEVLMLRQAQHIVAGEWLGPYTAMTLARGAGFQLWLAAMHTLGLPLSMAASLGWSLACGLLYMALAPVLPHRGARLAIFTMLLFVPEALGDFNLLRELLYPTWVLAMTAAACGLMLRAHRAGARAWPWALALGFTSAAFAATREEWVLGVPLWAAVALVLLAPALTRARGALRHAGLNFLAAAAAAALPLAAIATMNERHYGVWTLVELNTVPFTAAFGALTRVRHAQTLPHVPVPSESWARIAAVSPAFAELKPRLEAPDAGWFGPSAKSFGAALEADAGVRRWLAAQLDLNVPAPAPGDGADSLRRRWAADPAFRHALVAYMGGVRSAEAFLSGAMEREIGGSLFVWVLREAAAAAGHHHDAISARRFYTRLAAEVNAACADGRLACRSPRASLAPPISRDHRVAWPAAMAMATAALLRSENHSTVFESGALGEASALAAAERFVHQRLAQPDTAHAAVQPLEALIEAWRHALPPLAAAALLLWLWQAPAAWPRWLHRGASSTRSGGSDPQRALWWLATLVLGLVLLRLAVIALIHVSSWPAALNVRYLAPAQPLLVLFVALVAAAAAERWRTRHGAG